MCVCVCLFVCLSVRAVACGAVDVGTSLLVWCYILTTSRSSLSIKVLGSESGSCYGKCLFLVGLSFEERHYLIRGLNLRFSM